WAAFIAEPKSRSPTANFITGGRLTAFGIRRQALECGSPLPLFLGMLRESPFARHCPSQSGRVLFTLHAIFCARTSFGLAMEARRQRRLSYQPRALPGQRPGLV